MAPPPPWVLVVVLWVYTPDGDFSVMPLSTSSIRSSSITTAGTRGGGGDVGGHGDTSGGGSIPFSSPTPPPPPCSPTVASFRGLGYGTPTLQDVGWWGAPPRQPGVGGWMGKWGWEGPPPPRCGTADESNRSRMGNDPVGGATSGPHGIARCSVVLWGGCEDPPPPHHPGEQHHQTAPHPVISPRTESPHSNRHQQSTTGQTPTAGQSPSSSIITVQDPPASPTGPSPAPLRGSAAPIHQHCKMRWGGHGQRCIISQGWECGCWGGLCAPLLHNGGLAVPHPSRWGGGCPQGSPRMDGWGFSRGSIYLGSD